MKYCRQVSEKWKNYIDNKNLLWIQFANNKGPKEAFKLACKNGHWKLIKFLMEEPTKFDCDVNAKNWQGLTAFQWSCFEGCTKIVEILIEKSHELKIKLNRRTKWLRKCGFHLACTNGHSKIADMLMLKSAEHNIDLNAKDGDRRTAFHMACSNGHEPMKSIRN